MPVLLTILRFCQGLGLGGEWSGAAALLALVLVGLYVRLKLNVTPIFQRAVERGEKLKSPLMQVLRNNPRELVLGTFAMVATDGLFYLMTTWVLPYAIGKRELGLLGIGYRDFLVLFCNWCRSVSSPPSFPSRETSPTCSGGGDS